MDYDIEYQKKLWEVFNALNEKNKVLESEQIKLGYQQRNELISHVYSKYNNDEKLKAKNSEWEAVGLEQRVVKWVYELMRSKRSLYGYFENPEEIISVINSLIKQSEEKELYEIANILNSWRLKVVKP